MIKLIASDMDGTLLDSNRNINEEFEDILKELKSKEIIFAAVSGRDMESLKNVFKHIEDIEDNIVFASNNGNYIKYKDKVIFENYIEKDELEKIAKIIRKAGKHITIYASTDKVYTESIILAMLVKRWRLKIEVVKDITKVDDKIFKVSCFGKGKKISRCLQAVRTLEDEFMVSPSGTHCFDVCKLGGTKEQGINVLQEVFDAKYEETMVFGDHLNDLEMMRAAYYSYAMANAENEVKNNARFIAKTNDENGVIEVIKNIVLSKEKATV